MFPDKFHLKLVAEAYKIPFRAVMWRARKLGIFGYQVTNEQAFDIANYDNQNRVEVIIIYITFEIIPSRLNNTTLENL